MKDFSLEYPATAIPLANEDVNLQATQRKTSRPNVCLQIRRKTVEPSSPKQPKTFLRGPAVSSYETRRE